MSNEGEKIKKFYEDFYESYWLKVYRAYLKCEELDEDEGFLEKEAFDFYRHPEMLQELPETVVAAYNYYSEYHIGHTRVCKIQCGEVATYAVCVSTDGDDGWLEIYNECGHQIGVGRTYIELISWGEAKEIREQISTSSFPSELIDRQAKTLWQFGSTVILKGSSERFVVGLEEFPSENKRAIMEAICTATGIKEGSVEIVLECLPHSVTKNISRDNAEDLWRNLVGLGAKATVKEYKV